MADLHRTITPEEHDAAAFLLSKGWRVDPPAPPPRPRSLVDYERDEFHLAAERYGWRGGHPAVNVLPPEVRRECEERAARRYAQAMENFGG